MIPQLLFRLSAHLRCRIISGPKNEAYLERYHLLRLPFGFRVYLHRFVASDPGRALHNHPWRFAMAWVLSGHYLETRMGKGKQHGKLHHREVRAGRWNYIDKQVYHRINLKPGEEVWSLFIHSRSSEGWGFVDTRDRQFSYQDHNDVLMGESNPDWWKTAQRPRQNPAMRQAMCAG